jgi:hypothetical protein
LRNVASLLAANPYALSFAAIKTRGIGQVKGHFIRGKTKK